ncbi:MAG: hypothetical protein ABIH21_02685 [Patescibacteria group bacterium]
MPDNLYGEDIMKVTVLVGMAVILFIKLELLIVLQNKKHWGISTRPLSLLSFGGSVTSMSILATSMVEKIDGGFVPLWHLHACCALWGLAVGLTFAISAHVTADQKILTPKHITPHFLSRYSWGWLSAGATWAFMYAMIFHIA